LFITTRQYSEAADRWLCDGPAYVYPRLNVESRTAVAYEVWRESRVAALDHCDSLRFVWAFE